MNPTLVTILFTFGSSSEHPNDRIDSRTIAMMLQHFGGALGDCGRSQHQAPRKSCLIKHTTQADLSTWPAILPADSCRYRSPANHPVHPERKVEPIPLSRPIGCQEANHQPEPVGRRCSCNGLASEIEAFLWRRSSDAAQTPNSDMDRYGDLRSAAEAPS